MPTRRKRVSIVIHPLQGDETNLNVSSFASSIDGLKKVASKFRCGDLEIIKLTSESPVTMTFEGADDSGSMSVLFDGLEEFKDTGEIPLSWNRTAIDAVTEFLGPVGKSVGRFALSADQSNKIILDPDYKIKFENKIEGDFSAFGTVDGMLDVVNIHGKKNTLTIYPTVGKDKIVCQFDDQYLDKVKDLIGFYVEITGEMKYRWRDKYPHSGVVSKIEAMEDDNLPKFADLLGMAPNATKGVPAEDFVARIRSEWK